MYNACSECCACSNFCMLVNLLMHSACGTSSFLRLSAHSGRSVRHWQRRSHKGEKLQRSLVASAEREQHQQPWSADTAGHKQAVHRKDINLVLVHPQIPQNAGSVARTCAATSVALHLVKPLGFEIDSRKLKRAGLDYWPFVVVQVHDSWQAFYSYFQQQPDPKRLFGYSKYGMRHYAEPGLYKPGDWLMFGAETTGLPPEAHAAAGETGAIVKIPIIEDHVRSLNLAVSAGVGLYEAVRQLDSGKL